MKKRVGTKNEPIGDSRGRGFYSVINPKYLPEDGSSALIKDIRVCDDAHDGNTRVMAKTSFFCSHGSPVHTPAATASSSSCFFFSAFDGQR